jgi:hypothetical protein
MTTFVKVIEHTRLLLEECKGKVNLVSQAPGAHICKPSYLEGLRSRGSQFEANPGKQLERLHTHTPSPK